jgi:desulfoferrodoxin-like iron-binding protein
MAAWKQEACIGKSKETKENTKTIRDFVPNSKLGWRTKMSKLGKRYKCEVCGTELLCTKAGEGTLVCCEKEMKIQEPKPLPSSD